MTLTFGTALTPVIVRDRELRALESKLASGARLITLTGPGGIGKTTLAREVLDRRRGTDGPAYFVDLVGIRDPGLVPGEIATEIGVIETADLDAAGAVVAALRESTAVLVVDNLEELRGSRDFLAGLLQAAPGLQLMATSRLPLGVRGEVEFQVQPLELPNGDEPAVLEASPAGALFLERARALRSALELVRPKTMGVPTEVLVAAVAVLTVSNAPLLAARVWEAADPVFLHSPDSPDRVLGKRLMLDARRAVDPVAFEIARRSGATSALEVLVDEVLAYLDAPGMPPRKLDRLPHGTLTQRELEVLALVGVGKTNDEIAAALFISPKTASVHVSNAKAKLGIETRLAVALWARERGLVSDAPDVS